MKLSPVNRRCSELLQFPIPRGKFIRALKKFIADLLKYGDRARVPTVKVPEQARIDTCTYIRHELPRFHFKPSPRPRHLISIGQKATTKIGERESKGIRHKGRAV